MFKTIAIITALALTTTACTHGPQQTYKNYAKKVNKERADLNLKSWQWSPTEIKVMAPIVVVVAAGILLPAGAAAGGACAGGTLINVVKITNPAGVVTGAIGDCVTSGF
jgi:hypothetical protein